MLEHDRACSTPKNDSSSVRYKMKRFSFGNTFFLLAVEFRVYSIISVLSVHMLNGKMDFASYEDEMMDKEINDQHEEISETRKRPMKIMFCQMIHISAVTWRMMMMI